jgi:SRSO17 transposase
MIRQSWTRVASIEETLALWAASLREIKKRIRPLFRQERVAANAGLFLEGLLGDEQRKTGWMRAEAAGDPGPWRQQAILGRSDWDAMLCAISSAIMSSSIWRMTTRCS